MTRTTLIAELLRWARERFGVAREELAAKFTKLPEWEDDVTSPTLKQVEAFSRAVHVPVGYLFLAEPPEESVPVPDFRTFAGELATRPTPNILDTVYICQEPQSCYREFARITQQTEANFVGSVTVALSSQTVAARMRETLGFDLAARRLKCATPIGIAAS